LVITPSPQFTVALNTQPEVSPLMEKVTVKTPSDIHWDALGQGVCAWVCHGNPATKAIKINVGRNPIPFMIHLCCARRNSEVKKAVRQNDTPFLGGELLPLFL
jgi:hypothetical protein